jgi:quercetin dioxygenase-like cupin family protein
MPIRQPANAHRSEVNMKRACLLLLVLAFAVGCHHGRAGSGSQMSPIPPRPTVIPADGGEKRFLRGGTTPLLLKVDPTNTGSRRMVLGSSDLPPGDAIGLHRHLQEDEIIVITRGTARVQLGRQLVTASAGATVFIPQGTCIGVTNVGADTLSNFFVFSSPGFEDALRAVSSAPGEPPKPLTPQLRRSAFHDAHAVADPSDC